MSATPHGTEFDVEALSAHVARELERFRLPGVEVVVVREGEVLFAGGFGRRDVERDLPVTPKTVFAHGSTGKAFTSFLVGQLVEEGVLDWDRPIRDYLPDFKLADPVASERITVRDLLRHRSGIPRHDLAWLANPGLDRGELVRRMRYLEPSKDLRTLFQYCNFGYVAAGFLCGHVTNSTYEEQVRRRIFEPLGMSNTYLSTSEVTALEDHAQPYEERDERIVPITYRDASNVLPAGGINSCADDTARWLLCQLGGGQLDGQRLISSGSLATTHSVEFPPWGLRIPAGETYRIHGYAMAGRSPPTVAATTSRTGAASTASPPSSSSCLRRGSASPSAAIAQPRSQERSAVTSSTGCWASKAVTGARRCWSSQTR